MTALDVITKESAADIADLALSLRQMLRAAPFLPSPLFDAIERVAVWGQAYAREPWVDTRHLILDALSDLDAWAGSEDMPASAAPLVVRARRVVDAVRAATDPAAAGTAMLDAIEALAAQEAGVTVEVYRAEQDEAGDWRCRMSLVVEGIDTDSPSMPGADMLSEAQLRALAEDLLRRADAKRPTPPSRPSRPRERAVPVADGPVGPLWTGQAVA